MRRIYKLGSIAEAEALADILRMGRSLDVAQDGRAVEVTNIEDDTQSIALQMAVSSFHYLLKKMPLQRQDYPTRRFVAGSVASSYITCHQLLKLIVAQTGMKIRQASEMKDI